MQLAITQNPHIKEPKLLWDMLNSQDRYSGVDDKLDKAGFALFKDTLRGNSKFVVK